MSEPNAAEGAELCPNVHVTEALDRDVRRRRLQQIIEEYERESGVIRDDELAEIRRSWSSREALAGG
jgi:hypothetical protein